MSNQQMHQQTWSGQTAKGQTERQNWGRKVMRVILTGVNVGVRWTGLGIAESAELQTFPLNHL